MIRGKCHHRRPDPLLLLVVVVILCAAMTSAATAGELFNFFSKSDLVYRPKPQDSGFTVASMGNTGGGLNVSLTPPSKLPQDFLDGRDSAQNQEMLSNVFLFLRYPW
jgi:hypothetical protein